MSHSAQLVSPLEDLTLKYSTLLEVSQAIASHRELSELFQDLAERLRLVLPFDYMSLRLYDRERSIMRRHVLVKSSPVEVPFGDELPVEDSLSGWVWRHQQAVLINSIEQETRFPRAMKVLRNNNIKS